jgi:hypothetical protein
MSELSFTIESIEEQDYNGDTITNKMVRPSFDSVEYTAFGSSFPTSTSDADCKTSVKTAMTSKGITWDTEI